MAMLLLKNHLWATFQQQIQYSLTIKVFCNIEKIDTTAIFQVNHSEANTSNPAHHQNLRYLSIAVIVRVINRHCNHTAIIGHLKINCDQSQATCYFSPDFKALGRKSLTPSDGGLYPATHPCCKDMFVTACESCDVHRRTTVSFFGNTCQHLNPKFWPNSTWTSDLTIFQKVKGIANYHSLTMVWSSQYWGTTNGAPQPWSFTKNVTCDN